MTRQNQGRFRSHVLESQVESQGTLSATGCHTCCYGQMGVGAFPPSERPVDVQGPVPVTDTAEPVPHERASGDMPQRFPARR